MNSSPVLPQPRLSIGQMLAGRYTLQSLASHVCGAWLAQDEIEDRPVTLQLLAPELRQDPRAWNELRRQVEICRGLDHPHIAALHELVDEPEGPAFLVLEQAEGRTLAALQQEQPQKVFSWEWLRPRLAQICQALQYAHARQAVHGAVQPENILLNRLGDVKLLHFGVSAVLANPLLSGRTHQHLLAHLSPQVIQGGAPGAADDIYSLGVTLYRALSGTTPFYGADILSQIRNSNPVPLEARLLELQIRNPLPPAASRFVLAALSKKPEVRPHDPCELIAAEKPGKPCPEEAAPGGVEAAGAENSSTAATQPTVAVTVAPTPASPVAGDRATAEEPIPKSASRRTPLTILAGAAMLGLAAGAYYWAERLRHEPPPEPSAAVESLAAPVSSPPAPLPLAAAAPAAVKNPDAKVAAPVEPGFKSLFNGRDLTGWTGDAKHWSVREGSIVGMAGSDAPVKRHSYLVCGVGALEDFELRFSFRCIAYRNNDQPNCGIEYRGAKLRDSLMKGYQYEIVRDARETGAVMDDQGRRRLGGGGAQTLAARQAGKDVLLTNGMATPPAVAGGLFRKDDWNEGVIVARGNRLTHQLNGQVVAEVVDENPDRGHRRGLLALELYTRNTNNPATFVQFKDLRIKTGEASGAAAGVSAPEPKRAAP